MVSIGCSLDQVSLGMEKNITIDYLSFVTSLRLKGGHGKNERITE